MDKMIILDSAPLSLLAKPAKTPEVVGITAWVTECSDNGHRLIIPEIIDYEVRRELLRLGKTSSLRKLDTLKVEFIYLPLTTQAMLKAAEFWAQVRRQGQPTAADENIDVDVILAAQALTLGLSFENIVVATVNPRHLSRFVTAKLWQDIDAT